MISFFSIGGGHFGRLISRIINSINKNSEFILDIANMTLIQTVFKIVKVVIRQMGGNKVFRNTKLTFSSEFRITKKHLRSEHFQNKELGYLQRTRENKNELSDLK